MKKEDKTSNAENCSMTGQHLPSDPYGTDYPLAADNTGDGDPDLVERYDFSIHGHDPEKKSKCRNGESIEKEGSDMEHPGQSAAGKPSENQDSRH